MREKSQFEYDLPIENLVYNYLVFIAPHSIPVTKLPKEVQDIAKVDTNMIYEF